MSNISASFSLKFPTAKYSDFVQHKSLKGQVLSIFKDYDSTSVLSTFEVDTSAPYETELSIYVTISWETSDVDAEAKANSLIEKVKSSSELASLFTNVSPPFDTVLLDTTLEPLTVDMFVTSTIHSLVTTYDSSNDDTDIEVKTVGLYDHIGIKINTEDDNKYRRLRTNGVKTINIVGIDPTEDVIIATLFDKDYKKLYTSIQTPQNYIQQTQGISGNLLNESVDGSITLDLNYDAFTTENQTDFINTMNLETGGYTIIINVYQGSAIVEYRVIFDASKTQQDINDVITKLNDSVEVQHIINKSSTMVNVLARKTENTLVEQKQRLTKQAKIIDVIYDEANLKIAFKTIGSYKYILYKATEQETFLSTTDTHVDLPPGFTNKIDVKLVDINDKDINALRTYNFDVTPPFITLNGDAEITLLLGSEYVEQGAAVTDDSGENITPIITGSVDTNVIGMYTITYTAIDSSDNTASVIRVIHVIDAVSAIQFESDLSNIVQTTGGNVYYKYLNGDIVNSREVSWSLHPFIYEQNFDYNGEFAIIFKSTNTGPAKNQVFNFGTNVQTWSKWAHLSGVSYLHLEGGQWNSNKPVNTIYTTDYTTYQDKYITGYYIKMGRKSNGYNFVQIYDMSNKLQYDVEIQYVIDYSTLGTNGRVPWHYYDSNSGYVSCHKGVLLDRVSTNITVDDWIAAFEP